jgi:hypothetical protein
MACLFGQRGGWLTVMPEGMPMPGFNKYPIACYGPEGMVESPE